MATSSAALPTTKVKQKGRNSPPGIHPPDATPTCRTNKKTDGSFIPYEFSLSQTVKKPPGFENVPIANSNTGTTPIVLAASDTESEWPDLSGNTSTRVVAAPTPRYATSANTAPPGFLCMAHAVNQGQHQQKLRQPIQSRPPGLTNPDSGGTMSFHKQQRDGISLESNGPILQCSRQDPQSQ